MTQMRKWVMSPLKRGSGGGVGEGCGIQVFKGIDKGRYRDWREGREIPDCKEHYPLYATSRGESHIEAVHTYISMTTPYIQT